MLDYKSFDYKVFFNKLGSLILDHPLLSAILFVDFGVLLFHRPPVVFSLVMLLGLVALAMFFSREMTKMELSVSSSTKS